MNIPRTIRRFQISGAQLRSVPPKDLKHVENLINTVGCGRTKLPNRTPLAKWLREKLLMTQGMVFVLGMMKACYASKKGKGPARCAEATKLETLGVTSPSI